MSQMVASSITENVFGGVGLFNVGRLGILKCLKLIIEEEKSCTPGVTAEGGVVLFGV